MYSFEIFGARRKFLSVTLFRVTPLQGCPLIKFVFSITQGVALGYCITPFQGLVVVVAPTDTEYGKLGVKFFLFTANLFE